MNGTMTFRERLGLLAENALAWLIESGAMGGLIVLAILASFLGAIR